MKFLWLKKKGSKTRGRNNISSKRLCVVSVVVIIKVCECVFVVSKFSFFYSSSTPWNWKKQINLKRKRNKIHTHNERKIIHLASCLRLDYFLCCVELIFIPICFKMCCCFCCAMCFSFYSLFALFFIFLSIISTIVLFLASSTFKLLLFFCFPYLFSLYLCSSSPHFSFMGASTEASTAYKQLQQHNKF